MGSSGRYPHSTKQMALIKKIRHISKSSSVVVMWQWETSCKRLLKYLLYSFILYLFRVMMRIGYWWPAASSTSGYSLLLSLPSLENKNLRRISLRFSFSSSCLTTWLQQGELLQDFNFWKSTFICFMSPTNSYENLKANLLIWHL